MEERRASRWEKLDTVLHPDPRWVAGTRRQTSRAMDRNEVKDRKLLDAPERCFVVT